MLFHEYEIDCHDETHAGGEVVPFECLALEEDHCEEGEDDEGDDFLDDFQLDEGEGTAVALEAEAVAGDLQGVFEECHAPGDEDDAYQRPVVDEFHFLEFEVTVPGEGHEDVGADEQQDGV